MKLSKLFSFGRKMAASSSPTAAPAACIAEPLEARQFLSATLKVENLDIIPGYERMIFNRIQNPNTTYPNYVKDRGTLKLTNAGNSTLTLGGATISGPFKLLNALPASLPAGKSVTIGVQFTATAPPRYTYNQTNYTNRATAAGAYVGSLSFKTNDPANATYKEGLAGWFQGKSEDNQEPGLQTIVNVLMDYKTNISSTKTPTFPQGTTPKYVGEEVVSAYWKAANPAKSVSVRNIAAFHSQGYVMKFAWYNKATKGVYQSLTTAALAGQSLLPYKEGQKGVAASTSISPGSATFGFKIDNEYSDDKLNSNKTGGGHHVRFWPVRDHLGNKIANTYFMAMDYSVSAGTQNWDFQDGVYIISNIVPAGN
ncbi:MAG: glucosyl hydrolase family protein [Phycisphaerales bacterium]|nr:glucosyl hydrolase family protein [Phycisphaerales bacterium]